MSSNPFRRKPNDGTPSVSGRTSLDIDQERLQQVAQQAFADGDDVFEQAGSSGPTTVPDIRPTSTTAQVATKAPESIPESTEDGVTGDIEKPSVEVTDKENKLENHVEDLARAIPPVIPSDVSEKPASQSQSVPPTPPPARPVAPPAPPRPRRSVKRPREEVTINKPILQEAPIVEVLTPVAPSNNDPFAEAKLKAEPEDVGKDDESSIYEIKKEDAEIASVKSIESEYEEDSASEVSEVPTTSAASLSVKTVASEPEYAATTTSPQTQPPNPFRKTTDSDNIAPISRQDSLENERNDKLEALPPPIKFGNQQAGGQGSKANRQSLDVDAFKRLMLTGQAVQTPDSVSTTETSNLSKQSLFENVEQSYTPRSSQDTGRSAYETEAMEPPTSKVITTATPLTPKAKPPPPKPRGQRNSMPPPPRSEPQSLPVKETVVAEAVASEEAPTTPPKTPKTPKPPAPLSRRVSAQITSSPEGGFSFQPSAVSQTPPPPPPLSRRNPPSPKQQPTTPPTAAQEPPPPFSLNTSPLQNKKPAPPPARRGSKRMSAPPGRLQAAAAAAAATGPTLSKTSSMPAPPPPPIRKKSQLSQSTTEAVVNPNEPPPRTSSSFDILEDLTKLQKEVDQLLGRV
ncbi:hypothetical protein TWF788_011316 [Orbilia oligospora]|uniref:Uncharacterized protein n=1 Tax=Orbilia oligospora TaxID=2813651 RepID=A0A6G1M6M1_ORBOL|nr:hypothetical protein TWF788_011316 [Orbilia oligospora]KAF3219389.1 hypothetical protein TWF191_007935 [Orbilia oligospora]KAF3247365.1 hypothetical protein TWF192_006611 [Orbilia oligospora]